MRETLNQYFPNAEYSDHRLFPRKYYFVVMIGVTSSMVLFNSQKKKKKKSFLAFCVDHLEIQASIYWHLQHQYRYSNIKIVFCIYNMNLIQSQHLVLYIFVKNNIFVNCSLLVGGLKFSQKMNGKDILQENLQKFKKSYLPEPILKSLSGGVCFYCNFTNKFWTSNLTEKRFSYNYVNIYIVYKGLI